MDTVDNRSAGRISATPAIALCLSGGGFRATFYHLGVIKLLRDYSLLNRINRVYSVSGGSIMAAHLAINWDNYSRPYDEAAFYHAAKELVEFGRSDLRGRIVRRIFRRTRQLEANYASLLRDAELKSLASAKPEFSFLATSMTTGKICQFTDRGFDDGSRLHPVGGLPLALAVAASSAFPPLFPPVKLTRERILAKPQDFPLAADYLTDGGIFDNLGISSILPLTAGASTAITFSHILVSDASAPFDWSTDRPFRGIVSRTSRTTDILMQRVASLEEERWKGLGVQVIRIPISERVSSSDFKQPTNSFVPQDPDVQTLVGQIRTDLDEFSLEEICSLVRHGYEIALKHVTQTTSIGATPEPGQPSDPCVSGMPAVWPLNPDWIPQIPKIRTLTAVTETFKKVSQVQQEASRTLEAMTGHPRAPSNPEQTRETQIVALRSHLEQSKYRPWAIWSWNDWICWLLLLLIGALAATVWLVYFQRE